MKLYDFSTDRQVKTMIQHEASSGNIFADIGVSEPVEALAKADLARRVSSIIKRGHKDKETDFSSSRAIQLNKLNGQD